ncbi:ATP-binding protein [Vibrio furnissii]|uniref:ATP-binding protein n=1 Tax=Vibrio TaxID=662 RepID=UPI002160A26E|nr:MULTISPECIES: ATP-binding protein [Vibrio]MCS0218077.1 ATP-binding protein [Vibrio alginolyticus]WJG26805.1 ATP-binding protein [Vibrio furnissii]
MNSKPTYLGKVISVSGSSVNIELTPRVRSGLLMIEGKAHRIGQVGSFVRIPQGYNNLFGLISETTDTSTDPELQNLSAERRVIKVELIGESIGSDFERGISQYPSIYDEVHLVTESDLKTIYGHNDVGQVKIGKLSTSDSIDVSIDLDKLVNRHSAVLGSTGAGKSTSVSSLLRSIVHKPDGEVKTPSARIILFDLHGEYSSALSGISQVFSVMPSKGENSLIIPYWCVAPERLIDFLCGFANDSLKNKFIELIISEKQLFVEKNNQLGIDKDKITQYTPIPFDLRKIWGELCFEDKVTWLDKDKEKPAFVDGEEGNYSNLTPPKFQPPGHGNSAPFRGGSHSWHKQLELMRTRLLDRQYDFFLSPNEWSLSKDNTLKKDISELIYQWVGNENPITIIDLSLLPSERLDLILGSLLDILFESALWGRNHDEGMKTYPLLLVMEEAHRYLSSDSNGLAKNMVRRIAKEGRKFGVGSMLVSQRPSEIDETILSQCGTLFSLRISNATDRSRVKAAMSDGLSGIVDSLPILRTGEAIVTGEAARLPMRFKFNLPREGQYPNSSDPNVSENWAKEWEALSFDKLTHSWRTQNPMKNR